MSLFGSWIIVILSLAQHRTGPPISARDQALIQLILIGVILGIGLLVVIGLVAAWRNYIQRQREIELEHEHRDAGRPRPDAWATAAQRLTPEDAGPDEAHVSMAPPPPDDLPDDEEDNEENDEDDFPFDYDDEDDEDDDGPIGQR